MSLSRAESPRYPHDWPSAGPIDLGLHDLPHASSTTEWWYLNCHLTSSQGRPLSLFAAFFEVAFAAHPDGRVDRAHFVVWALSDVEKRDYIASSFVDQRSPPIVTERLKAGRGAKDPRLNRALSEVLKKGAVPLPDRMFTAPVHAPRDRLALDFGGCSLTKLAGGEYQLRLVTDEAPGGRVEADLVFLPKKAPVRHGDDGVVRGDLVEDMFYYFIPRCEVSGSVLLAGQRHQLTGLGWYDHEFGRPAPGQNATTTPQAPEVTRGDIKMAWNWLSVQLDDGTDISVYELVRPDSDQPPTGTALIISPDGTTASYQKLTLTAADRWRSTRTFEYYPTRFILEVPEAGLKLEARAEFPDQEFVTIISKPAFWEGRCTLRGTLRGAPVSGLGFIERNGFNEIDTLDDFFKHVGEAVRESVSQVVPLELDRNQANLLVTAPGRERFLDGVDLPQLSRTLVSPVREITDRGGKAWRSYAALACCDVVEGDSRKFVQWLAFPELMHTGSLIVDDVQDKSVTRRGGPAAHVMYGDALALNAGTAAYFMGERLLNRSLVDDAAKLKLYDLYFEALREGHAGQAIDIDGLAMFVPAALDSGDLQRLEERVLAIHRLKTAAPAAALARMGGIAGGGTAAQVEAVGNYFEAMGLAFQMIDDVLNLRGFKGDLKQKGEDLSQGKVTLPVVKAFARLDVKARWNLWHLISSRPQDPEVVGSAIASIEACGALDACEQQAKDLVNSAWEQLDPVVPDSLAKMMLRAFGWYVLERHY